MVCTDGSADHELTLKDLVFSISCGICLSRKTAIDSQAPCGAFCILDNLFAIFREIRCWSEATPILAECRMNLHVVKLNGAAVRTTPRAINATDTSLCAGFSMDMKSIAASLSLLPTELSSPECIVDCSATGNVVCTDSGTNPELTVRVFLSPLQVDLASSTFLLNLFNSFLKKKVTGSRLRLKDGDRLYPESWSDNTPLGGLAREVAAWLGYVDPKHEAEKLIQRITKGTLRATEAWTDGRYVEDDKYVELDC